MSKMLVDRGREDGCASEWSMGKGGRDVGRSEEKGGRGERKDGRGGRRGDVGRRERGREAQTGRKGREWISPSFCEGHVITYNPITSSAKAVGGVQRGREGRRGAIAVSPHRAVRDAQEGLGSSYVLLEDEEVDTPLVAHGFERGVGDGDENILR